jgi:hypothetical protein
MTQGQGSHANRASYQRIQRKPSCAAIIAQGQGGSAATMRFRRFTKRTIPPGVFQHTQMVCPLVQFCLNC